MKRHLILLLLLTVSIHVSACGVKRDLKLPSEIEQKEQKKRERMQVENGKI